MVVAPILGAIGGYAGAGRVADKTKMLLFCRKETEELADALRAYLAAAIKVLRAMIERAEHQARSVGVRGGTSSPAGLGVINEWRVRKATRLHQEIDQEQTRAGGVQRCLFD